ncbi:MAG TPA: hypothetical protein PLI09_03055 [Candidatus Hydrogenedentes bacterium]|nr:hypothetical protein [Candidatus Hydrogenedentota bacterium]
MFNIEPLPSFTGESPDSPRTIPFNFGQKPINRVEDFKWGKHYKACIAFYARQCRLEPHEMKTRCGYTNYNRFLRRREQWSKCLRPIPLIYLDLIGVDMDLLREVVTLDQKEYETAIQLPLQPEYFTIRIMAAVYSQGRFPPETSEEQAIEHVQTYVDAHPHYWCCIPWPGLKTIYFNAGKPHRYVFYRPELKIRGGFVELGSDGSNEGITRIL